MRLFFTDDEEQGTGFESELSSQSSSISTDTVLNIIEKLKGYRLRESTRQNYLGIWRQFSKFYLKLDNKPENWEQRIILFAGFLIDQKKKSTTVQSYISAIKTTLQMEGFYVNENQYLLTSLTRACMYKNDRVINRQPIQLGTLRVLLRSIENYFAENNQDYLAVLYKQYS